MLAARPVYYHAPLYRRVAETSGIDFKAIFASSAGVRPIDGGYGRPISWGLGAIEGFESTFLRRADSNPNGGSVLALRDFDVAKVIKAERFDALWLHGYHTITHLLAARTQSARGGALLVREEQTLLRPRPRWKEGVKGVLLPRIFGNAYGLYIGTENHRWFVRWGFSEDRLFFTPYTVDNDRLQGEANRLAPERNRIKESFDIPSSKPVVLSVLRFIPEKQPFALLEAFRRLRALTDCALLLVGSGPLEKAMRLRVRDSEIPDVIFAGFLDQHEIPRAYVAADVFVLASERETWGLVVNEAMNFSLPIVVTRAVGSATDLVRRNENGFVVDTSDGEGLTHALQSLVTSPDQRREFGRNSLRRISTWTYGIAAEGVVSAAIAAVESSHQTRLATRERSA
jgi:glycosyltransferase involved in cell wall biosynthesis